MIDFSKFRNPDSSNVVSGIPYARHKGNMDIAEFFYLLHVLILDFQRKNKFPRDIILLPHGSQTFIERYIKDYTDKNPRGEKPRVITYDVIRHEPMSEPFLSRNYLRLKPVESVDEAIYNKQQTFNGNEMKVKEYSMEMDSLILFSYYTTVNYMSSFGLYKFFEHFLHYVRAFFIICGVKNYTSLGLTENVYNNKYHLMELTGYYRKSSTLWLRTEDKYIKSAEPINVETVFDVFGEFKDDLENQDKFLSHILNEQTSLFDEN